jgi:hypothetical protein
MCVEIVLREHGRNALLMCIAMLFKTPITRSREYSLSTGTFPHDRNALLKFSKTPKQHAGNVPMRLS